MADPSLELIQLMLQRVMIAKTNTRRISSRSRNGSTPLEFSNASLSRRLDRVAGDVELIKHRLDLVPAA